MKKLYLVLLLAFCINTSQSQELFVGGSYSRFSVRGNGDDLKGGWGPGVLVRYNTDEEDSRTQAFLDVSFLSKSYNEGETEIHNIFGESIGYAETTAKYNITQLQLGLTATLAGDYANTRMNFFMGGGVAFSFVNTSYNYKLADSEIPEDKYNQNIFGFHFNMGTQYRLKPVILELRGGFDFMLKPIQMGGGDGNHSYFLSTTKLCIIVPIIKEKNFWK